MDSVLKKLDSNNIEVKYIDNFYKYQNTNQKLQIRENTQQIKFKFLN